MQTEGGRAPIDTKRPPPGLEPLSSSIGGISCKAKGQPIKVAGQETPCFDCTSYRSVAARAIKEGKEAGEKIIEPRESTQVDAQVKGRGGSLRTADRQSKDGRTKGIKGSGLKEVGSASGCLKQADRKQHMQERRLQDEIRVSCPLPTLDESLENPQELLKLKTLFVGEIVNGLPRRRPPIDEETGRLLYWDRRCYSFDSGGATCASGSQCIFCHTIEELLLHPARFRSELMAPSSDNAWHCATSIAELRLRAPEAYGLDAHLRRLQSTQGQDSIGRADKNSKHLPERLKTRQGAQSAPQVQKRPQLLKHQRQQQQQQVLRQSSAAISKEPKVAPPKNKQLLGEDVRACSSSSTEVNSVEDSCGSSSGCCSSGDCGVLCDFAATAPTMSATANGTSKCSNNGVKSKGPTEELLSATKNQAQSDLSTSLSGLGGPASPVASNGRTGAVETSGAVLAAKGVRLAYTWSDQEGELNLSSFKVFPCRHKHSLSHDKKYCPFYHNFRDKRRFPVTYRAEQCEEHFDLDSSSLQCSKGDACDKSHNRHELLYHPSIFKQRFCSSYATRNGTERCGRGQFCAFAHSREEVRAPLFSVKEETNPTTEFFMQHFKTVWCPYGVQHDWYTCVYAHTYQDCRRSPEVGYGSEPCPAWNKDVHSADYGRRCPHGTLCPYSHGSKEQLYHPSYYKTMPCMDYRARDRGGVSCPRGILCAFYHEASERRWPLRVTVDYSVPLPPQRNSLLQQQFLRPPLFNLDDFEAFGHTSRKTNPRKETVAPEMAGGRIRGGFRRGDNGNASNGKSPPPTRRCLDQPSGHPESLSGRPLDATQQKQGTHQAQLALVHQQPSSAAAAPQTPFAVATSSFSSGLAFDNQQQHFTEAKALALAAEFSSLGNAGHQWQAETHQQQFEEASITVDEKGRELFEELGIALKNGNPCCGQGSHVKPPELQKNQIPQQDSRQQQTLQLAAGLNYSSSVAKSGFGSWLLKHFADEKANSPVLSHGPLQGSRAVTTGMPLPRPQDMTPRQPQQQQHQEDELKAAVTRSLGEKAPTELPAVYTPIQSDGLLVHGKASILPAHTLPNVFTRGSGVVRGGGLFDNSGVWGAARPELSFPHKGQSSATEIEKIQSTSGTDALLELLGRASHASDSRFLSQSRDRLSASGGEELSESAARLPPVPPPSFRWYCLQASEEEFNGGKVPGATNHYRPDDKTGKLHQEATLTLVGADQCEDIRLDESCIGEEAGDERLFNSAISLQRLVTFDSDSGQEQVYQQTARESAPLSFSLGIGITPAERNFEGDPSQHTLRGTHLASLYLITSAVAHQERVLLRLVSAKASPKVLLLRNTTCDFALMMDLERSAATAGYSVVHWEARSDEAVAFWEAPGTSLGMCRHPSGNTELAELLERAASCGSHVFILYVHTSEEELGKACRLLASYPASPRVVAAQERLLLLHLCPTAPPLDIREELLQHLVTLPSSRLPRWSNILTAVPTETDGISALSSKANSGSSGTTQLHQNLQEGKSVLSERAGGLYGERRLLSTEELRAAVSPTYSVYSLPCMHEDLQWSDPHGHTIGDAGCPPQQRKEDKHLLSLLRRELEERFSDTPGKGLPPSNSPCVLVELEEGAVFPVEAQSCKRKNPVAPPGFKNLTLRSELQNDKPNSIQSEKEVVRHTTQEAESLGFTVLHEKDRATGAWFQQLGASLAVMTATGAPNSEQQPHSWSSWGTRRFPATPSTSVLFRRAIAPENEDLLSAFLLLAEAQAAAGDCRGLMRCLKAVDRSAAPSVRDTAVYVQPSASARAQDALWVASLHKLVLGHSSESSRMDNFGSAEGGMLQGASEDESEVHCCVCGAVVSGVDLSPPTATCNHRYHSSCRDVLLAGNWWPCPCALLWPCSSGHGVEKEHLFSPSQALRQLVLELSVAVTEAYGLLRHIHTAAYGNKEPQNGFLFALKPQDVIISASSDGALSVCIDVASPHVLRAALQSRANAEEAGKGRLGTVLESLISLLLTRGRASPSQLVEAPLLANLLGSLRHWCPDEVQNCRNHPFFWDSAERLSFLQVALALAHLPHNQHGPPHQDEGDEEAWGAKLAARLRSLYCTGRSWLLTKAYQQHSEAGEALIGPPALGILNLVDKLRQRWLSFSSQLSVEEVEALLKEMGLSTCQQRQQQQRLLLVQHADKALSRHVEIEVPGLLLAVFLLARDDPAVLEMMHASPSLISLRPALSCEEARSQ